MPKKVVLFRRIKINRGGSEMEATIKVGAKTMPAAKCVAKEKTDWDEIAEWGCRGAKEKGITRDDSREMLKLARKLLNESCR